jgi:hypothetical protein
VQRSEGGERVKGEDKVDEDNKKEILNGEEIVEDVAEKKIGNRDLISHRTR